MSILNLECWEYGAIKVLLEWIISKMHVYNDRKPKLEFVIADTKLALDTVGQRIKTSPSEYMIEIINVGTVPVIIDRVSLYKNGHILVDCFLDDEQRKILPNQSKFYQMMEQDRLQLQRYCNEKMFSKCDIVAYCINGNTIKGNLDVFDFYGKALENNGFIGRKRIFQQSSKNTQNKFKN